jgi:hypothetical protein
LIRPNPRNTDDIRALKLELQKGMGIWADKQEVFLLRRPVLAVFMHRHGHAHARTQEMTTEHTTRHFCSSFVSSSDACNLCIGAIWCSGIERWSHAACIRVAGRRSGAHRDAEDHVRLAPRFYAAFLIHSDCTHPTVELTCEVSERIDLCINGSACVRVMCVRL